MCVLKAWIGNLAAYNNGELRGDWISFPTTNATMHDFFEEIGVGPGKDEEIFIADYESDIEGLTEYLGEYENLSLLNWLAAELMDASVDEDVFAGALELGDYTENVLSMIELARGLDNFMFLPDVNDDDDLGWYYINEGLVDVDKDSVLFRYFDAEGFGRDIRLESGGTFCDGGYIECIDDHFIPLRYEDCPDEYKITF